jgi:hypothetical protein
MGLSLGMSNVAVIGCRTHVLARHWLQVALEQIRKQLAPLQVAFHRELTAVLFGSFNVVDAHKQIESHVMTTHLRHPMSMLFPGQRSALAHPSVENSHCARNAGCLCFRQEHLRIVVAGKLHQIMKTAFGRRGGRRSTTSSDCIEQQKAEPGLVLSRCLLGGNLSRRKNN